MVPKRIAAIALVALIAAASSAALLTQSHGSGGFVRGVYADMPRGEDGRIDVEALVSMIEGTGADTYNLLIIDPEKDFESLEELLPAAAEKGIDVWVTILPPSALSEEKRADMRYVDYIGWARRIASLSLEHGNLKAWSLDNVLLDRGFFTADYIRSIAAAADKVNPDLMFIPVAYYRDVTSPDFAERSESFDGIQFYYMGFPQGTTDGTEHLLPQLEDVRSRFGGKVILGVYASPWSKEYPTSAEYVDHLLNLAEKNTDGVMIYTLNQKGEKLEVIRKHFGG